MRRQSDVLTTSVFGCVSGRLVAKSAKASRMAVSCAAVRSFSRASAERRAAFGAAALLLLAGAALFLLARLGGWWFFRFLEHSCLDSILYRD